MATSTSLKKAGNNDIAKDLKAAVSKTNCSVPNNHTNILYNPIVFLPQHIFIPKCHILLSYMNMLNEISVQMLSFCDKVFCFYISLGRED